MISRRSFVALSGLTGASALGALASAAVAESTGGRDFYELQQYRIDNEQQQKRLVAFAADAAIPALRRIGIGPVGVFQSADSLSPIYVLLRHRSLESLVNMTQRLSEDEEFLQAGADFLDAPKTDPAFARLESSLLQAFSGMPHLETPIKTAGRVFQLRTYESPSVKTGLKKIEMFNQGELDIFRQTGLHAVFFGQALVGAKMPNLTYMLVFESREQQDANWKRFGSDPAWRALRAIPEYADERILCGITNLLLKPLECSEI